MRDAFVHAEGVAKLVPFLTDEPPTAWVAEGATEEIEVDEAVEGPPPGHDDEDQDLLSHRTLRLTAKLLPRQFVKLCKHAGWILVSVATDPQLAPAVVAGGGMRAIVAYAAGDDEQKTEGAWAIANLSSDPANAPSIVEAGGLQLLLGLLDSASGAVRLQARRRRRHHHHHHHHLTPPPSTPLSSAPAPEHPRS